MEILNNWLITAIAYGGGFGAVFFGLFHFLGKSWLENKFQERLNDLKHQQNIEVARLKVEIDSSGKFHSLGRQWVFYWRP